MTDQVVVKDVLLTATEYDALVSAAAAFDGLHMDKLSGDDKDYGSGFNAELRRQQAAISRVLIKARAWTK